jgi:glycosyltransferase involved in cell wall biosynthesis
MVWSPFQRVLTRSTYMIKLAWNMIVKNDEHEILDTCLGFLDGHVDGMFIAITHKPGEVVNQQTIAVCEKHKAVWKSFEWINDFSAARNFALSMIPSDYTHWGWCDSDDGVRSAELMKSTIEKYPRVDLFNVNYLFHFDKNKNTDVVHQKTMIIKNDGCVKWYRPLHEDFQETRQTTRMFVKGIERIHMASEEHFEQSKKRNVEISKIAYEKNPQDPGYMWNYGQSLFGNGQYKDAKDIFDKFIAVSQSDEERYLVYIKIGQVCQMLGDVSACIEWLRKAIGLKPEYPDAYHVLGQIYYNNAMYQKAAEFITLGLTKKPPYHSIIVYNPRDYDFFPMMLLGKTFYALSRPDQALTCLEACKKMDIENTELDNIIKTIKSAKRVFDKVIKEVEKINRLAEKAPEKLPKFFSDMDDKLRSHPSICALRNKWIVKKESSGKDLVYYAGFTEMPFCPSYAAKKGIGGSEEAIINLSKEWVKMGWNVTVYCNTGNLGEESDGVKYRPFWEWNYRDKQDITILWRQASILDKVNINSSKIFIDLHDVIPEGEFTPKRLDKITKIMVKTPFHRSLFPNISDDKFVIIPNGQDFELFNQDVKKDQYLIVNTSSPDRSLNVLPEIFKRIKQQVPEAKCKWAYGFDLFEKVHDGNDVFLKWAKDTKQAMQDVGIENLGRLSQKKCAQLYLEGNVLLYPTEFAEIDCITVKKAQACGCLPVTTDFAALDVSVKSGVKIHSEKTKDNWCQNNQFYFGVSDETMIQKFVDETVKILKTPINDRKDMKEKMEEFRWDNIAKKWNQVIN